MTAKKSEEQKRVEGTARPDRQDPEPPRSEPGRAIPNPPRWLDRYGRAKWRELVPDLASRRLLTGSALDLLETLCSAYGDFRRYEKEARPGATYQAETGAGATIHRRRHEATLSLSARKEYTALAREFRQLVASAPPVDRIDPMDAFLERRQRASRSAVG